MWLRKTQKACLRGQLFCTHYYLTVQVAVIKLELLKHWWLSVSLTSYTSLQVRMKDSDLYEICLEATKIFSLFWPQAIFLHVHGTQQLRRGKTNTIVL